MTTNFSSLARRPYGAIAAALLLASALIGCAQAPGTLDDPTAVSGSSAPGQIDFHGFPYNIQSGL
jgi:hypothetical protein